MKLKKKIPLIDQSNKLGFWGGKFGGNFVPETSRSRSSTNAAPLDGKLMLAFSNSSLAPAWAALINCNAGTV